MPPKKRKEPVRCCVVNCNHTSANSPGTRFYRFPTATVYKYKQERRDRWIRAVGRLGPDRSFWLPCKSSRICSQHFIGNAKSEHPLNPSYSPSIFPSAPAVPTTRRYTRRARVLSTKRVASSNKNEELDHDAVEETETRVKFEFPDIANFVKIDKETQVSFSYEDDTDSGKKCRICTCNRYMYVDRHTTKCDVEIQVFIPDANDTARMNEGRKVEERCRSSVICEDRATETCDSDCIEYFNDTAGFSWIICVKEDRQMLELAGVTLRSFRLLIKQLPAIEDVKISKEQSLLIFLFKIKQGVTFSALSALFSIEKSTASRIFFFTLRCLAKITQDFVPWPGNEIAMSAAFQENHDNLRAVIEFRTKETSSVKSRCHASSHCKKNESTLKVLVTCTPSGNISFVSSSYRGQTTRVRVPSNCQLLEFLEADYLVTGNEVFPRFTKFRKTRSFRPVPLFLLNNTLPIEDPSESYQVSGTRTRIKRVTQSLRSYRILDGLTGSMVDHRDAIVFVCCVLVNLHPLIKIESNAHQVDNEVEKYLE